MQLQYNSKIKEPSQDYPQKIFQGKILETFGFLIKLHALNIALKHYREILTRLCLMGVNHSFQVLTELPYELELEKIGGSKKILFLIQ